MPERSAYANIPTEVVRTIIAIAETGSLTKAGERVGLSQPAISSQMKRIDNVLGGKLFTKTPNGASLTELGKMVLHQARKMMEANDQILRLGGTVRGPQPVRFGISTLFVREFLRHESASSLSDLVMHTDNSLGITRSLIDGFIDVACFFETSETVEDIADMVVHEREEAFVWVRSKDFVLSPGAPIPLLTWPGDDIMVQALLKAKLSYSIVFNSPDYYSKIAALEVGMGLAALPARMVPPSLVQAKEYYLPPLPKIKALLCTRGDVDPVKSVELLKRLSKLFFITK